MVNETNTAGGWYCAYCQRGVDPSEVTFRETHEVCGRMIADDEPPAVDIVVERDNLKQEVERLREALKPFAAFADVYIPHADAGYGNYPRTGSFYGLSTKSGSAEITAEDIRNARAALHTGG